MMNIDAIQTSIDTQLQNSKYPHLKYAWYFVEDDDFDWDKTGEISKENEHKMILEGLERKYSEDEYQVEIERWPGKIWDGWMLRISKHK